MATFPKSTFISATGGHSWVKTYYGEVDHMDEDYEKLVLLREKVGELKAVLAEQDYQIANLKNALKDEKQHTQELLGNLIQIKKLAVVDEGAFYYGLTDSFEIRAFVTTTVHRLADNEDELKAVCDALSEHLFNELYDKFNYCTD